MLHLMFFFKFVTINVIKLYKTPLYNHESKVYLGPYTCIIFQLVASILISWFIVPL